MIAARSLRVLPLVLGVLSFVAACGDDTSGPGRVPTSLVAGSPVMVAAQVGSVVAAGAKVVVRDQNGDPLPNVPVTFAPATGAGVVETPAARTNGQGIASSGQWTLGKASGQQRLIARVARLDSVEFVASAAPGEPATIIAASGAPATATVATPLAAPPAVIVRDQYTNPVPGVRVTFSVESGGGTATGTSAVTDAQGTASVGTWTLGVRSGPQTLRAQAQMLPAIILTVEALAGPAEVLRLVSGADQITQVGTRLAAPLAVAARDAYDNPVARRQLSARIAQGGGTIGNVVTDDAGVASLDSWSMGNQEGLNAVDLAVDGLPSFTVFAKAVPVSSYDIRFHYLTTPTASQRAAFEAAAARWRQVIIGDLPAMSFFQTSACNFPGDTLNEVIDDLVIVVRLVPIDGPGKVLGSAGPCYIRSNGLPFVGVMNFDTDDVAMLEASNRFEKVVLHEVGHILGIGTLWQHFGLITGRQGTDPFFTGVSARAGFALAGGAAYLGTPVPIENTGGPGTRDGHWRETELNAEVMTGFVEAAGVRMPLSLLTIGSLEDMGYRITTWGDDTYSYFTPGGSRSGISASRARIRQEDLELIEVPLPEPRVADAAGRATTISPRISAPWARTRQVTGADPRPVQQLEVRRPR